MSGVSKRLNARASNNRRTPSSAEVSDEAVRKRVPEGVTFVPNVAYREGRRL